MVDVIDFTLLLVVVVTTTLAAAHILPNGEQAIRYVSFWSGIAFGFVYLVLLKHSRFRTLGYLVGGIRIVTIQGERPSIWSLTIRAMFAFFGPLNMLIDLMWVTSDEGRQSLRDKFAHTYVIRDRAVPMGQGAIVYARYTILGELLVCRGSSNKGRGPLTNGWSEPLKIDNSGTVTKSLRLKGKPGKP